MVGKKVLWWGLSAVVGIVAVIVVVQLLERGPRPGFVTDEAMQAGRTLETMPPADEDFFAQMDGGYRGVKLSVDEVKGRNNWILWTAGNDRLWDALTNSAYGTFDLLKTISNYPGLKASRDNRWQYLGVVNEPCFRKTTEADNDRFGLWLDIRDPNCAPDPFANETKYPGVKVGARGTVIDSETGKTLPVGSYYGEPTGIVGLRLFPNPEFDADAAKEWDALRYYTDPSYYNRRDLIRPYRVGMGCGFCHVGPDPVNPPVDPNNPKWDNLSSIVGAQFFWIDRIFSWSADQKNFIFQLVHTAKPGTLDTSLVSTDYINNPRTMNAVYMTKERLELGLRLGKEKLAGGGLENKQFKDFPGYEPYNGTFRTPDTVLTPHVLKDGADSVGALGALNRVYINIGLFSEEWLLHFNALVGGKDVTPIRISDGRKNSVYWQATESQTPFVAQFFLNKDIGAPHLLANAPDGARYLSTDAAVLTRGREVFAENCAACHSSKQPAVPPHADPREGIGRDYLKRWNAYWAYVQTPTYKAAMRDIALKPDFLDGNFLSTEMRVPVTLLATNACSPLATNGIAGNIWDNFTSQSYKDLPSVGTIKVRDPFSGEQKDYVMPAGGRGYTRPATLAALWSTAPYLLNNSVGPGLPFDTPNPTVEYRVNAFDASIREMLWPERRRKDTLLGNKGVGEIYRTTDASYLSISAGFLPPKLAALLEPLERWLPWLFGDGGVRIGPIPKGTPVNLLSNLPLRLDDANLAQNVEHDAKLLKLVLDIKGKLKELDGSASDEQAVRVFQSLREPLLELSKCPDFEVNRGHYFGTGQVPAIAGVPSPPALSDPDKEALIAFLKTL
ncbi:hypothetical protein ACQKKX_07630 [Neorhizobium sp. NPDC001467]|uniref:hypothetical protein n=1 Tax=Neorhizobium sp. NPDC001467 TaxID=3390595 RepID=UPI003D006B4C